MIMKNLLTAAALTLVALPAAAEVRWNDAAARAGFESLPEAQRRTVQSTMKEAGIYTSGIDGRWGPGTARSAKATAEFLEDNSYGRFDFDLHTPEAAGQFFQFMLTNTAGAYLWGEGEECDGPDC